MRTSAMDSFIESLRLTERQRSIFASLVRGEAPKQIADSLGISHVTVRRHLEHVYRKSGTQNQRELLALFARIADAHGREPYGAALDANLSATG